MKNKFKKDVYIPITKVDDEQRMVYGWASTPEIDSDGEIIKAEAMQKALPNYMKFPTIREMHAPVVAGTTKQADASEKGLYIGAYIPVDEAWKKIKEGLYRGFSIGGNVIKRVGKTITEIELVEISLVDVPANKGAVVELWKREKMEKNAYTAYSAAMMMIQLKDMCDYFGYLGKDTSKLDACLEMVKEVVAAEALEPEAQEEGEGMPFYDAKQFYTVKSQEEMEAKVKVLEGLDLSQNAFADALRKGVIIAMKTKAEELKKEETVVTEVTEEKTETTEVASTEGAEVTTETKETAETTETTEVVTEEKEAGSLAETLTKLSDIQKTLDEMKPKEEVKVEKVESTDLSKAVGTLAGTLSKVAELIVSMNERMKKLEATPAAPKAKVVTVAKEIGGTKVKEETPENPEIAARKARIVELEKLHNDLGPNEFAKAGYSMEASRIYKEIDEILAKGK